MAGYIVLGIGFGVLLADKGYSFWWAVLMSTVVLAGTLQYVGVELLATGASLISTILMSLMINARHLFYGISMLKKYGRMDWKRFYAILPSPTRLIRWCVPMMFRRTLTGSGTIFFFR